MRVRQLSSTARDELKKLSWKIDVQREMERLRIFERKVYLQFIFQYILEYSSSIAIRYSFVRLIHYK